MFGQVGVLIIVVALTIVLAAVFLVRPAITAGATGKILAFVGLCILPALCIGTGMSFHMQRSKQTAYCVSCHSMESHGQSLYVLNTSYIPAQHFQNHLVPPNRACYTCHTDYTMYGPLKDKLKGLRYLYMEYVSTPPKTIHLDGKYSNLQCLHCHTGMRTFDENPTHTAIMGSLRTNQIACISCHDTIHNVAEVGHLKMWVDGDAPASPAAGSSSSAPAKAEPAATSGPSKAPAAGSESIAATAHGKHIFDSQRCSACHGESGGGGSGPALTHTASQYPPAQLTDVLKAPTPKMKAAGMVPLTVDDADMKALVSYVSSLGGTSTVYTAKPPSTDSTSPAPAAAEPSATAVVSKVPAGNSAGDATTARGKIIFDAKGCNGCHGESGGGGTGPPLAHISSHFSPAQLAAVRKAITAVLNSPTAKMRAAGMVPLSLDRADMDALASYVSSVRGASVAPAAAPPAAALSSPAPAAAGAAATYRSKSPAAGSAEDATATDGKAVFDSQRCSECHGDAGVGSSGPALTHISGQYPPEKLTAVLKAPTPKMKAGGMVPLTVDDADMKSLVSYVSSLGGASTASVAAPPAAGSSSPAPAAAGQSATATPSKPKAKKRGIFHRLFMP